MSGAAQGRPTEKHIDAQGGPLPIARHYDGLLKLRQQVEQHQDRQERARN
jgi:hypothetical protein